MHPTPSNRRFRFSTIAACGAMVVAATLSARAADEPVKKVDTEAVQENLKHVQEMVGQWQGSGKSDKSQGWDETIECAWKFGKGGKVSLYFQFGDPAEGETKAGRLLSEGMLTFDPEKERYIFRAYSADANNDEVMEFAGAAKSNTNLVLDRVSKGEVADSMNRLDLKILNDGDRLVYTFQRRIGKSKVFKEYATIGLNRQGTTLAGGAGASGPKCIVTGGAGTMTVSYMGKSFPVCCTGCRDAFLDDPEKWIARAEKAAKKE
ncbi:MAG: hypothetical protein ACRC1K_18180 [Planctomycetia bacterium]